MCVPMVCVPGVGSRGTLVRTCVLCKLLNVGSECDTSIALCGVLNQVMEVRSICASVTTDRTFPMTLGLF